jgi:hypothetical protein
MSEIRKRLGDETSLLPWEEIKGPWIVCDAKLRTLPLGQPSQPGDVVLHELTHTEADLGPWGSAEAPPWAPKTYGPSGRRRRKRRKKSRAEPRNLTELQQATAKARKRQRFHERAQTASERDGALAFVAMSKDNDRLRNQVADLEGRCKRAIEILGYALRESTTGEVTVEEWRDFVHKAHAQLREPGTETLKNTNEGSIVSS